MRLSERVKTRFRRFLQRPGTQVDLGPLTALLPDIEAQEERLAALSDEELIAAATALRSGEEERTPVEAAVGICALAREAAKRALDQRPFDVQLVAALAMLDGHVAEMATGEGKTLAATIAAFGFVVRG